MKTSYPFCLAALKIRSMFSTVLFSLTLSPTAPHARPLSLKTSFCGSIKTTAVSTLLICIVRLPITRAVEQPDAMVSAQSSFEEREQFRVDFVFERRAHAVRCTLVDLQFRV